MMLNVDGAPVINPCCNLLLLFVEAVGHSGFVISFLRSQDPFVG
jgi:hypothetical protein